MLLNSILHGSSCLADVDFTAATGNPVNYAVLFSWFFFFFFLQEDIVCIGNHYNHFTCTQVE